MAWHARQGKAIKENKTRSHIWLSVFPSALARNGMSDNPDCIETSQCHFVIDNDYYVHIRKARAPSGR
ncbi:hypothetical protein [Komagataeibacter xylinus]|uniref:hypothetical protein n=1 Tax=Komagataeibacter xylinus TaxID=28448 RepID=UPI0013EECAF2|nr:hypothetical protein [Komagataeibacter xylinus]